jgi:hypothetical protein
MKQVVIFADRREQVLRQLSKWWRWIGAIRKKSGQSFQKNFQNTCEIEKKLYFCTASRDNTVSQTRRKKQEHVPRHIELTAVLRDLKTKNESNRMRDLNKPLDLQSK